MLIYFPVDMGGDRTFPFFENRSLETEKKTFYACWLMRGEKGNVIYSINLLLKKKKLPFLLKETKLYREQ